MGSAGLVAGPPVRLVRPPRQTTPIPNVLSIPPLPPVPRDLKAQRCLAGRTRWTRPQLVPMPCHTAGHPIENRRCPTRNRPSPKALAGFRDTAMDGHVWLTGLHYGPVPWDLSQFGAPENRASAIIARRTEFVIIPPATLIERTISSFTVGCIQTTNGV
jgi:hypothetical protein